MDETQIRQLINDSHFVDSMNEKKGKAGMTFTFIIKNFLGNKKTENYIELFETMFKNLKYLVVIWALTYTAI